MDRMDRDVTQLCHAVMAGVARAAGDRLRGREDEAVAVMRAEIKAALVGATPTYQAAREAVALGSLNSRYLLALIVTECLSQLFHDTRN